MKTFLMALVLLSSNAFAQEIDATEMLASIIPVGTYSGSYKGKPCKVTVQPSADGLVVTASNAHLTRRREVERGSIYAIKGGNYFLSSGKYSTNDGFNENILMTRSADITNRQYVVVADRVVVQRDQFEHAVECIIPLF